MDNDKASELFRYEKRAADIVFKNNIDKKLYLGSFYMPTSIRKPYLEYEKHHLGLIKQNNKVLEIGSGSGLHTFSLLKTGALVIATDISPSCLQVIDKKYYKYRSSLKTQTADMESLPFKDNVFHVVTSAGSLSYGDNEVVMNEIYRVLKKNGIFICVDSLNHNPIYRFNRWLHYLRGNRTLSTLNRMPTVDLLKAYGEKFGSIDIRFFGSLSWLAPMLNKIFNDINTSDILDKFDNKFSVKKSAFKFVMVVKKVK